MCARTGAALQCSLVPNARPAAEHDCSAWHPLVLVAAVGLVETDAAVHAARLEGDGWCPPGADLLCLPTFAELM